ncbi:hypothetical protein ACE6H2_007985 [Prunus campanulata]
MSNLILTTYNWWKIKNRANNEENLLKTKRKGKRVKQSNKQATAIQSFFSSVDHHQILFASSAPQKKNC